MPGNALLPRLRLAHVQFRILLARPFGRQSLQFSGFRGTASEPGGGDQREVSFFLLFFRKNKMSRTAPQVLQEEFLIARARILELAAIFDRIDRAATENPSNSASDLEKSQHQRQLLEQGIAILQDSDSNRASRVQKLMSRPYDSNWREQWTI